MSVLLNQISPKLEVQYELWTWNGEDWNKQGIKPQFASSGRGLEEIYNRQVASMPNCPVKIMKITEVWGN